VNDNPSTHPLHKTVIAIDGPAGAGKSTIARCVAQRLGLPYLDTGAMYRALGLLGLREGLRPPYDELSARRIIDLLTKHRIELQPGSVDESARVLVDGKDVSAAIRTQECAEAASAVSAISEVRRAMVRMQREIGNQNGGVMEGRDIGSVVFPDADLKLFLTASAEERAKRRKRDLEGRGLSTTLDEVHQQQSERDYRDTSREDSPLQVARGAVVVDTTRLTIEEVVERILHELERTTPTLLDSAGLDTVRSRNHGS